MTDTHRQTYIGTYKVCFADKNYFNQECKCGILYPTENSRIVGGESVTRNIYPWVVAIFDGIPLEDGNVNISTLFCGGTLITKNQVLTSARCLYKKDEEGNPENQYPTSNLLVGYGEFDLRSFADSPKDDWLLGVAKVDIHPNFDKSSRDKLYDAAIITLSNDIDSQVVRNEKNNF